MEMRVSVFDIEKQPNPSPKPRQAYLHAAALLNRV
jgi:hypothetical protein